jgi:hypothetical protein
MKRARRQRFSSNVLGLSEHRDALEQVRHRLYVRQIRRIEAERRLYAQVPSRSELIRQLLDEALAFRSMARPGRKKRGEP